MATVIVNNTPTRRSWTTGCHECCAEPGGLNLCCYVLICPCCAAGDVASAAGRDYCMSCCVMPYFGCHSCWWCGDRAALVQKYGIEDSFSGIAACCLFMHCPCCMLIQELNHVKAVQLAGGLQTGATVIIAQPQQNVMR